MLFAAKLTIYWHAWCQRVPANQQDFDTAPMRITPGHRSDNATKYLVVYPSIEPRLADHSAPAGTYYSFCESSVSGRVGSVVAVPPVCHKGLLTVHIGSLKKFPVRLSWVENGSTSIAYISAWCTSGNVKGCKMPAPSRRPVSLHKHSTGRRLTSLEGGNRGTMPHSHGRP